MSHLNSFRLYITGVTGTGKTSVAKRLTSQLSLNYFEINDIILEKGFFLGYDINRDSVIVDDDLLASYLDKLISNINRLCLVGPVISIKKTFDLIIVLRCRIEMLRNRLRLRNYPEEKIEANAEAEIMNIVYYDAIEIFSAQNVIEVYSDEYSVNNTCQQIISIIRQHKPSVFEGLSD